MIPDRTLYADTISLQCTVLPAFEHVTLEQAKNHARVDTDDDDALITTMITAARMAAEGKTRRVLCESTWEWQVRNRHWHWQREVPVSPCSSCEGVTLDGTALATADYYFVASGTGGVSSPLYASLSFPNGVLSGDVLMVTVKAGYPQGQCPEAIVQWMLVKIGSFYEQRENFVVGTAVNMLDRTFVDHLLDPYILP